MLDSHTILSNLKCHTECSGVHLNYTSHRIPSHKIKSHTNPRENASKVAQYALVHPDGQTDGRTDGHHLPVAKQLLAAKNQFR